MDITGGKGLDPMKALTPIHGEHISVTPNFETTVVLYVVPAGYNFFIQSILCSGEDSAKVNFYINGEQKVSGEISIYMRESKDTFGGVTGVKCGEGDILNLTVTHTNVSYKEFGGTILGFLEAT